MSMRQAAGRRFHSLGASPAFLHLHATIARTSAKLQAAEQELGGTALRLRLDFVLILVPLTIALSLSKGILLESDGGVFVVGFWMVMALR